MEVKHERGLHFYLTLAGGIVTTAFLISGLCVPDYMVFELKPYARVVLQAGNLDNWTAASIHLDPAKFAQVKENYPAYLKGNRNTDGSDDSSLDGEDSSDSSSDIVDDKDEHSPLPSSRLKRRNVLEDLLRSQSINNDTDDAGVPGKYNTVLDTGSSSSSGPGESSESSDSIELTLEERLQGVPIDQTVRLGLFGSRVCEVSQSNEESCHSSPVVTGLQNVIEAAAFAEQELTMPFWNNVRMESLFSLVAAAGGLVCLLATLHPCCYVEQTPFYLSAISFFATGILAFIPVIRIALISSDFRETLEAELNVTTELRMPWSILLSAFGGTFALISLAALLLGDWCHVTKRLYRLLSLGGDPKAPSGNEEFKMHHVSTAGSMSSNGFYDMNKENENSRVLIVKA